VNYLVLKEFELPPGCLQADEYDNKSAEYIYNSIPVEECNVPTLDSHEEWQDWGNGNAEGKGDGPGDQDGQASGKVDDLEQQWRERVATAATQARMRGKMPGHLEQLVGEILQPKLDWKAMLRDMVTSCAKSDYRLFPSNKKHLWRGFYLPGITGEEIRVAVAIDSSGSISDRWIQEFMSEVKGICDTYEDYTIYGFVCDTQIHQKFELHPFDSLPKTVAGRGGTSFKEPIKEAENLDITTLIYFTDLYGDFPDKAPRFPVIWVCTTDAEAPWGYIIRYPTEDKRR